MRVLSVYPVRPQHQPMNNRHSGSILWILNRWVCEWHVCVCVYYGFSIRISVLKNLKSFSIDASPLQLGVFSLQQMTNTLFVQYWYWCRGPSHCNTAWHMNTKWCLPTPSSLLGKPGFKPPSPSPHPPPINLSNGWCPWIMKDMITKHSDMIYGILEMTDHTMAGPKNGSPWQLMMKWFRH